VVELSLAVTGYANEERTWTLAPWALAGHFPAMLPC
jgi:hypothetical protein